MWKGTFSLPNETSCFAIRHRISPRTRHIRVLWSFWRSLGSRCRSHSAIPKKLRSSPFRLELVRQVKSTVSTILYPRICISGFILQRWLRNDAGAPSNCIEAASNIAMKWSYDCAYGPELENATSIAQRAFSNQNIHAGYAWRPTRSFWSTRWYFNRRSVNRRSCTLLLKLLFRCVLNALNNFFHYSILNVF